MANRPDVPQTPAAPTEAEKAERVRATVREHLLALLTGDDGVRQAVRELMTVSQLVVEAQIAEALLRDVVVPAVRSLVRPDALRRP